MRCKPSISSQVFYLMLSLSLIGVTLIAPAKAQTTVNGSFRGEVRDSTGASLPGARVVFRYR